MVFKTLDLELFPIILVKCYLCFLEISFTLFRKEIFDFKENGTENNPNCITVTNYIRLFIEPGLGTGY